MPTAPTGPATRAHRRTSLAVRLLQDADPIPQGQRFLSRSKAMVLGRRLLTFPQLAVLRLLPTRENARAATRALASSDISSRRCTTRSRLCGNRGPTYVRANSAASSSVRTVTSRARRRGGLNTKSIMPRKLARHSRSSSGAVDAADNARDGGRITKRLWATGDIVDVLEPGRPRANMTRSLPDGRLQRRRPLSMTPNTGAIAQRKRAQLQTK